MIRVAVGIPVPEHGNEITLIHLNIGFFSIAASTFHPLPKVFSGIATQLGKVNGNPFLQHHDSLLAWLVDVAIAYAMWVSSW